MSPSEKFVQTSSDYISKNNWVKTVLAEKDQTGGRGSKRVLTKDYNPTDIFFEKQTNKYNKTEIPTMQY